MNIFDGAQRVMKEGQDRSTWILFYLFIYLGFKPTSANEFKYYLVAAHE